MNYNSRYRAKFAPISHWKEDETKRGFIPVLFDGEIRMARPIFQLGQFKVPSKEFVEQYGDTVAVLVEILDEDEGILAWSGFTYWEGVTPDSTKNNYPYTNILHYDENWKIEVCNEINLNYFLIEHIDGTLN